jgi:prepilin-type processing-associated H-X9-DG protein
MFGPVPKENTFMKANWQNLNCAARMAFTIPDLLATISMLVLLTFVAVPALRILRTTQNSSACISNQRELMAAWQMYSDDNSGKLVQNFHGSLAFGGGAVAVDPRNAPWALGRLDWQASSDNTNILFVRGFKYARLAPYLGQPGNVHKCPSDIYLSTTQRLRGWKARVRSYSMNATMGDGNAETGPWDLLYKHCRSVEDLVYPSPAESSVILDEHPDSINDTTLYPPIATGWIDLPGNLHNGAGTVAFADSHVETHPWRGRLRRRPVLRAEVGLGPSANDPDPSWLSYHSQRKGLESY